MIATKALGRGSSPSHSDCDSISSDESGGGRPGELMARASLLFTGFGRGVSLLNVNNYGQGQQRNHLQEQFIEKKNSNLFYARRSIASASDYSGLHEEDNMSLSDASTFEMPNVEGGDVGSNDHTGGKEFLIDDDVDIDRLQLEIQTHTRDLSGVTMDSVGSNEESELGPLPFFGKGVGGNEPTKRRDSLPVSIVSSTDKARVIQRNKSWRPSAFLAKSLKQTLLDEDQVEESGIENTVKKQVKSRAAAKLMHKHFQTANNPESFRELQKRMKEKGAVTGTSVMALLHDLELVSSDEDGEGSIDLDLDRSTFFRTNDSSRANLATDPSGQDSNSEDDSKQQELQQRLRSDPIFGNIEARPYINLPSREPSLQFLVNLIHCSSDEGRPTLLTLHGNKYLGKSKLMDAVVGTVQNESQHSFTVLRSERSSNTKMMSFYPFREVVSSALRACDRKTRMCDEQLNHEDADGNVVKETDSSIIQRLIERKILDKSDQSMLSRILPEVLLESCDLLSLFEGRSPVAFTRDTADALFKLMIPLQPVLLVFDSVDGDGELDSSSWGLLEELVLSSPACCPQMISILISRQPLAIPGRLVDVLVESSLSAITKADSEKYIQAVFDPGCMDKNMTVDQNVLDIIHTRANGCPLFLERLILWAQNRAIIEIDETRNAVAINDFDGHQSKLTDVLPATLNEEVLSEINNLSHNELDSLKVACCMGMIFSQATYEALESEGFFEILHSLTSSHRIFDLSYNNCFKWRHSVVFDAVSSIIITDESQEIHERICDSFGRSVSTTCDVQHARHYSITSRWDEAWDQYMDAGKRSEKIFDYTHAVTCYNQAKLSRRKRSSMREKISCSTALGWCLQALERYDDAEKELESSLEWTMSLPENDRDEEYSLLTALAKVKSSQSKYGEAVYLYEKALPIVHTKTHSPKWLAHHTSSYGEILRKSGELKRAKELHEEALKYREMAVEDKSGTVLELAISYTQLGCTHSGLRDYEKAIQYHKKALSARVSLLDFKHILVSESLYYCADSLVSLGKGNQALPLAMHAVKIRKQLLGPSHPVYGQSLRVLASSYYSVGRPLESLDLMKECLEICGKAFSSNHSNLIPNLMLYGKVLRVSGDIVNARSMYKRALFIHMINFRANQNEMQLNELERCIRELESGLASSPNTIPEMPIPPIESDPGKANIILCSNFGHRPCDEYALSVASSLQQMGSVNLITVVAVGEAPHECAQLARHSLDSLLLSEVPVAFSKVLSSSKRKLIGTPKASPYVNCDGVEMITRALAQAPNKKSITILCDSCLGDLAEVMGRQPVLFTEKVQTVVFLGSVQPLRRRSKIEPAATDDPEVDDLMNKVYAGCQQFNVATISVCKDVAKGFPFPISFIDDLTQTNHMISLEVKRKEETQPRRLWQAIKESRKSMFLSDKLKAGKNASPSVHSVNVELILGLLCCIPVYRDSHFRWEKHLVDGVEHKVCRHQNANAGIIKSENLSDEILMLIGFALRTALLNTSC